MSEAHPKTNPLLGTVAVSLSPRTSPKFILRRPTTMRRSNDPESLTEDKECLPTTNPLCQGSKFSKCFSPQDGLNHPPSLAIGSLVMQSKLSKTCLEPTWLSRVIKSWNQDNLRTTRVVQQRNKAQDNQRSSPEDIVNLRKYRIGIIAVDWQTQEANGSTATRRLRSTKIPMVTTCNRWGVRGEAILTAIDESVIVLLKSLGSISFLLEGDCSNTFWAAVCVVMKGDFFEGSNCLVKQFL